MLEFCPRDGTALPTAPGKEKDAEPDDPILDSTIDGRYAIEKRLGEGGMGVVYKARHVLIDKPVAIKILRKEAAQDTAAVQRFIQEAKSASKINQSNIVDITDFGVLPDGHAYFVMEFLEGKTLAQAIQEGPMESSRVCSIGAQMARGLHAAHTKGIVHRDLKPENIFLLEREGQKDFVKIVDFGIAKVGGGQKLTQVGMVLGTPEYMSPEQATGQETDHRVDQYAVGCIMYEMLTGVVPFLGDRPAQTLTKHVFEPVMRPRHRKPDLNIPVSLESVVLRTLAKKPDQRFPSMRELEQALEQVSSELKSGRVVVEDSRSMAQPGAGANPSGVMSAAAFSAATGQPGQTPPSGQAPYYPGQPGQPGQSGQIGQPGQQMGGSYPGQTSSPFSSSAIGIGAVRPTQQGTPAIKARRLRSILAAVAGVLLVVIALLVYFLVKTPPPVTPPTKPPIATPQPPPPSTNDPPPPVDTRPVNVEILVQSKPGGADILVNGETIGTTPYRLTQKRGATFRLEVRKKGYDSYFEEIQPEKDQTVDAALDKIERGGSKKNKSDKGEGKSDGKSDGKKNGKSGKSGSSTPAQLPTGLRDPFKRGK